MAEKPIDDLCVVQTQKFDGKDYVDYGSFLSVLSELEKSWKRKLDDAEEVNLELTEKCEYLEEQLEKGWNKAQHPEETNADVDLEAVIYEYQREIGELTTALDVIMEKYITLKQNVG